MVVFHIFKIVQMVPNCVKRLIQKPVSWFADENNEYMIRKLVVNEFTTFHLSLHYLKNVMKTPYVHVNDLINSTRNPVSFTGVIK